MKSILLASASIVAYAGAAAAEAHLGVTFGGSAELGYNDTDALDGQGGGEDTGFFWDADLSVTFTAELNNGLTAGAEFGIDIADTGNLGNDLSAADFVLSLTSETAGLYFGNTDTAAEKHWDSAGEMAADGFSENDGGTVLRGDVMVSGIEASVSYFIQSEELEQLQVAAAGTFGNFSVAFAFQEEGDCTSADCGDDYNADEVLGLSASTTLGAATVQVAYAQNGTDDTDSIGVEVSYPFGPVELGAYYVMESDDDNAFGISADYASGPVTVAVNYEDTDLGDEDWSIEGTYDAGQFKVFVGVVDAGEDMYAAAEFPLSDNSSITVSYADDGDQDDENDIGDPEYKEGATAVLSFEF